LFQILTNEKYRGSALLQKKITTDFLSKRQKPNEGEAPQYYIEKSHEAIIPPDEWEIVQLEVARRKALGHKYSGNSIFSARLICADCGEFFGSKVWNSTDKYRRAIWQCNGKYKGEHRCTTPHLEEQYIRDAFVTAFNSLIRRKDELIRNCRFVMDRYIEEQDETVRPYLNEIRRILRAALPEAQEKISWSMPTYWKGRNIIHFAASKKHLGLYPGGEATEVFADRLADYDVSKGTIRLPYNRSLPEELIAEIAVWCYRQYVK